MTWLFVVLFYYLLIAVGGSLMVIFFTGAEETDSRDVAYSTKTIQKFWAWPFFIVRNFFRGLSRIWRGHV